MEDTYTIWCSIHLWSQFCNCDHETQRKRIFDEMQGSHFDLQGRTHVSTRKASFFSRVCDQCQLVLESQRYDPPIATSSTRKVSKDFELDGFRIEKDTGKCDAPEHVAYLLCLGIVHNVCPPDISFFEIFTSRPPSKENVRSKPPPTWKFDAVYWKPQDPRPSLRENARSDISIFETFLPITSRTKMSAQKPYQNGNLLTFF